MSNFAVFHHDIPDGGDGWIICPNIGAPLFEPVYTEGRRISYGAWSDREHDVLRNVSVSFVAYKSQDGPEHRGETVYMLGSNHEAGRSYLREPNRLIIAQALRQLVRHV